MTKKEKIYLVHFIKKDDKIWYFTSSYQCRKFSFDNMLCHFTEGWQYMRESEMKNVYFVA